MCSTVSSLFGSLQNPPSTCFHVSGELPCCRPPVRYRSRFILPCRRASSEFLRSLTRSRTFVQKHTYRVFVPHRGITGSRPLSAEVPPSAPFRPQAFSASRRFAPRPGAAGLFHPATTSRVDAVQGLLPPCSSAAVSRGACPRRWQRAHSPPEDSGHAHVTSTSRPSSTRRSVHARFGFTHSTGRSPHRRPPPPGSLLEPYAPVTRVNPLMSFTRVAFESALKHLFDRNAHCPSALFGLKH